MKKCPKCGKIAADNSEEFCTFCGTKLPTNGSKTSLIVMFVVLTLIFAAAIAVIIFTLPSKELTSIAIEYRGDTVKRITLTEENEDPTVTAVFNPAKAKGDVSWSSSDKTVVKPVPGDGKNCTLVIVGAGETTVSASCGEVTGSVKIIVQGEEKPETTPAPAEETEPTVTPAPAETPKPSYTKDEMSKLVDELMKKLPSGVERPADSALLSAPAEKYIMTKNGNYMYAMKKSNTKSGSIGEANEGEVVTVYAIQNNMAFGVLKNGGVGGWFSTSLLADKYYSGPNPSDTKNLREGVVRPVKADYIDSYEKMYVKSKRGVRIYLIDTPKAKDNKVIGYINEADEVTVLARRGGFSFVITPSGEKGWCASELLVYNYYSSS